jgi:hypothetical protein
MNSEKIINSLNKLEKYILEENYKGFDPYDALSSPIFKFPLLRNNKFLRFTTQQVVKRSPINLRSLLNIPKGYNPVTLGLILQGYSYQLMLKEIPKQVRKDKLSKIEFLIEELERLRSKEFSGACWGYDFDWEARYLRIPAYQPAVVATGIIVNALFICYKVTGIEKAKELLISSANFVLKDLHRTQTTNHLPYSISILPFCFSYSPFDEQIVYNASMKGSRLLAQVYSVTKDSPILENADKSVEFVMNKQNEDGSWFYSANENGKWIDNYHTGYVLDCLDEYIKLSGDNRFNNNLKNGIEYYINNLFEDKRIPKFYYNKTYPIDCTAAGQAILTLTRFGYVDIANNVADYMIETMQDKNGYFYFRNYGKRTDKTSFMRWSNAWMFAALSYLLSEGNESNFQTE